MIRIHNVETGEIIDREMTAAEIKDHEANAAALSALKADRIAKDEAREALLARLGITQEEAALLLG
jgi:hypothetical protein